MIDVEWPHREIVRAFLEIGDLIEAGLTGMALSWLSLFDEHLDLDRTDDQLIFAIASALRSRALDTPSEVGNLYLQSWRRSHMELFDLLRRHVPMIYMTHPIANELLIQRLRRQERAVILDIGIGDGTQMADLIASLGRLDDPPRALTVVGLDLSAVGIEAARRRIESEASRWGIDLTFVALAKMVETLDQDDWARLDALPGARVVNATFALHHLAHDGASPDPRDRLLCAIQRWQPRAVVISETDVDLNVTPLRSRIEYAYRYFGGFFRHIDAAELDEEDGKVIKLGMLLRELEDILGPNELTRCERYESASSWVARLRRAGFCLVPPPRSLVVSSNRTITVGVEKGYVTLTGEGTSLVGILCAEPIGG